MIPVLDLKVIAKNCFSQEHREILEHKTGEITITVEDLLNYYFGSRVPRYGTEIMQKAFAIILHDNEYILKQIKRLQITIDSIINAEENKETETTTYDTLDATTGAQDSTTTTNSKTDNAAATDSDIVVVTDTSSLERGANTLTNKKEEQWDEEREMLLSVGFETRRKQVNLELTKEPSTFGDLIRERIVQEDKPEQKNNEAHKIPFHSFNTTKARTKQGSKNETITATRGISVLDGKSVLDLDSKQDHKKTGTVKVDRINMADSAFTSLTRQIPDLRHRFWSKFQILFYSPGRC